MQTKYVYYQNFKPKIWFKSIKAIIKLVVA